MSADKHTPTPWFVHSGTAIASRDGDGGRVADTPWGWPHSAADAEHIVRCVNAYDDLVAAVKVLSAGWSDEEDTKGVMPASQVKWARAILAKVQA